MWYKTPRTAIHSHIHPEKNPDIPQPEEPKLAKTKAMRIMGRPLQNPLKIQLQQKIIWTWRKLYWKSRMKLGSFAKRTLELFVIFTFGWISIPLIIIAAIAIYVEDRRNPFFSQIRCGIHGKKIRIFKLRTMRIGSELQPPLQKTGKKRKDDRITKVGWWLRKFSIDELPQLWNVIRGDISLVGPRVLWIGEVIHHDPKDWARMQIKPGITGLWQISGRSDLPFEKHIEIDLEYIRTQSLKLDLWIICKTIPVVLSTKGAY